MSATVLRQLILLATPLAVLLSCDRNIEPFVPGEQPSQPDLSRIFPAGAERAGRSDRNLGIPPVPEQGGRGMDPTAEAPPIRGTITVPDELRARVPGSAVLFVIARSNASGAPLAVVRIPSPEFPLQFEIGPEHRMMRSIPFAGELQVSARLDRDGDATAGPGDLQGRADGTHSPGASGVRIALDQVL